MGAGKEHGREKQVAGWASAARGPARAGRVRLAAGRELGSSRHGRLRRRPRIWSVFLLAKSTFDPIFLWFVRKWGLRRRETPSP